MVEEKVFVTVDLLRCSTGNRTGHLATRIIPQAVSSSTSTLPRLNNLYCNISGERWANIIRDNANDQLSSVREVSESVLCKLKSHRVYMVRRGPGPLDTIDNASCYIFVPTTFYPSDHHVHRRYVCWFAEFYISPLF